MLLLEIMVIYSEYNAHMHYSPFEMQIWHLKKKVVIFFYVQNHLPKTDDPQLQCTCCSIQAYLWDNNQVVVEWLEQHLSQEDGVKSAIRENIKYLKKENTLKHIRRCTVARILQRRDQEVDLVFKKCSKVFLLVKTQE